MFVCVFGVVCGGKFGSGGRVVGAKHSNVVKIELVFRGDYVLTCNSHGHQS